MSKIVGGTIGKCRIEYTLDLKNIKKRTSSSSTVAIDNEIRECSLHNPYSDTKFKSSVLSLSFRDELLQEVHVAGLPRNESVTLQIPIDSHAADILESAHNEFTLDGNDLVYVDLKQALSRPDRQFSDDNVYRGDQNTDLRVIVSAVSHGAAASGNLYFHRSETVEPSKENLTSTVDSVYLMSGENHQISFYINGRLANRSHFCVI